MEINNYKISDAVTIVSATKILHESAGIMAISVKAVQSSTCFENNG